jgi:hypothetical protein
MQGTSGSSEKDCPEWMVTRTLASYLTSGGSKDAGRMAWLFCLEADTVTGGQQLKHLCGFDWARGEVDGGPEESFKDTPEDRGGISPDLFRKSYWTMTPDFRYWTRAGEKQLIIEAKGTEKPVGQRDLVQAKRYFSYFSETRRQGAVVYLAPDPKRWLAWLREDVAGNSSIPFGVVDLKVQIVPAVSSELVTPKRCIRIYLAPSDTFNWRSQWA